MPTLEEILKNPDRLRRMGELGIKKSNLMKQFVEDLVALSNEEVAILMETAGCDKSQAVEMANNSIEATAETINLRAKHMMYQQHEIYAFQVY